MSLHDVVLVGGGVNALVAAGFLARAGKRVLVLEANDVVGGRAATDDFHPGFRGPATFAGLETFDPEWIKAANIPRTGKAFTTASPTKAWFVIWLVRRGPRPTHPSATRPSSKGSPVCRA